MSRVPDYNHCPCRFYCHRAKKYHQTVNSCSRYTICLLFGSCINRQNLPQRSPPFAHYPDQIEVNLYADVSENTLPFESQSINNISQSVGWKRPSLSPHFLLFGHINLDTSSSRPSQQSYTLRTKSKGPHSAIFMTRGPNEVHILYQRKYIP